MLLFLYIHPSKRLLSMKYSKLHHTAKKSQNVVLLILKHLQTLKPERIKKNGGHVLNFKYTIPLAELATGTTINWPINQNSRFPTYKGVEGGGRMLWRNTFWQMAASFKEIRCSNGTFFLCVCLSWGRHAGLFYSKVDGCGDFQSSEVRLAGEN